MVDARRNAWLRRGGCGSERVLRRGGLLKPGSIERGLCRAHAMRIKAHVASGSLATITFAIPMADRSA